MAIHVDTKTFKSGNSVAVRLPRELGFEADVPVRLEKIGKDVFVRPRVDAEEERRKVKDLVERLLAIGPPDDPEPRQRIVFPDRPGLYD